MPATQADLALSIIITVVSGKESVRESLERLCRQIDPERHEVIVPWDKWSTNVGELKGAFGFAKFPFIDDLGQASDAVSADDHRLYDRRRAIGLAAAKGEIIAMLEDRGLPAEDWVNQVLSCHSQNYAAIGGSVENDIDTPLNQALYYCDFGRYGRPFDSRETDYLSDINVSYKRQPLMAIRDVWLDAYQETTAHSAFRTRGETLFLDDRPVVYQNRPQISIWKAISERYAWGCVFGKTRVRELTFARRAALSAGTMVLPLLILARVGQNMRRQKISIRRIVTTLVVSAPLSIAWSLGELFGYISGPIDRRKEGRSVFNAGGAEPEGRRHC
jgi:hypothetical protein